MGRIRFTGLLFFLLVALFLSTAVSQTATSSTIIAKALAALAPGHSSLSITASGTVVKYDSTKPQTGTFTWTASSAGSATLTIQVPEGTFTESVSNAYAGPACTWSGPDGVVHESAPQNCLALGPWFFPHAVLFQAAVNTNLQATYIDATQFAGNAVDRIKLERVVNASSHNSDTTKRLTDCTFYFDSKSGLPLVYKSNLHPDDNYLVDIPQTVTFSDYRSSSGIIFPFRIQRSVNDQLQLDLTVATVTVN